LRPVGLRRSRNWKIGPGGPIHVGPKVHCAASVDPGISRGSKIRGTMGTRSADTPCNGDVQSKERARRFSIQIRLRYRLKRERAWREGRTENISRSGLLFRGEAFVKPATQIEMSMVLSPGILGEGAVEVICRGTVVRTVPPADAGSFPGLATTISYYRLVRS
jgi:hypothetical protein